MDHMKFETPDLTAQNIDKLAALFPGCVTEGPDGKGGLKKAVNFELLRQMLSDDVLEGDEAYEFTWVGKKASIVEANKPIRKTLRQPAQRKVRTGTPPKTCTSRATTWRCSSSSRRATWAR